MTIHLVRHGESTFNAEHRIQGQSDPPLSELGRRQSTAVADALSTRPIEAVFSSPLQRAWNTALAVAERHGLPVETDPRLMEINAGEFQGQLRRDLELARAEELARWLSGDDDFTIPGGESRRQLTERGCEVLRSIAANGHGEVVVVTHGGLLSVTLRALLGMSEPLPPFSLQNGSITRLEVDREGHFSLAALNQVEHLATIGVSDGGDL